MKCSYVDSSVIVWTKGTETCPVSRMKLQLFYPTMTVCIYADEQVNSSTCVHPYIYSWVKLSPGPGNVMNPAQVNALP